MTVGELREMAKAEKAAGNHYMVITTFRAKEPAGKRVRLLGNEGPTGVFMGASRVSEKVVRVVADYPVDAILAWCGAGAGVPELTGEGRADG